MTELKFPKPVKQQKVKKPINKASKKPSKYLKEKTWTLFSRWIRRRDCLKTTGDEFKGLCYTCGACKDFMDLQAGHFRHGHSKMSYFDERNVHAQCNKCNLYLSGNLSIYSANLVRDYGPQILDELIALSNKTLKQKADYYLKLVEKYEQSN